MEVNPEKVDIANTLRRIEDALRDEKVPNLIRVANILGVKVALIPEECPRNDAQRPCFGHDQVRCIHQLKSGLTYYIVHTGMQKEDGERPFRSLVKVVSDPFYKVSGLTGGWWVKVRYLGKQGYTAEVSLADMSITPFGQGWNQYNYFAFTDKSRHLAHGCCHHHCC